MPDPATEKADPEKPSGPVRVSIIAQLDPLWRPDRVDQAGIADIGPFAKGMTAYVAENLERFAGPRGADVYVTVAVDRDGRTAAHEYRSGHFVGMAAEKAEASARKDKDP